MMVSRSLSRAGLLGAALAMSLILGACGSSTPTPAPTPTPVVTPTATPVATPTPTPTPELTPAPEPTPTPEASPTPTASPTLSAAPTLPADVVPCTGSATVKQWFADQAKLVNFDLYCAVLPSGWGVVKVQVDYIQGGVVAQYKNAAGYTLVVYEGSFCGMSPNPCSGFWTPTVGPTPFASLTGELDGSGGMWSVLVTTSNPKVRYNVVGEGMTMASIKSYSAAMHKVG